MEYGSHVYGGSTHTASLNRVESKAFCLINSPPLTDCLDSLIHWRNVASLSLFYSYFHADCSSKVANCLLPSLPPYILNCCKLIAQTYRLKFRNSMKEPSQTYIEYAHVVKKLRDRWISASKLSTFNEVLELKLKNIYCSDFFTKVWSTASFFPIIR